MKTWNVRRSCATDSLVSSHCSSVLVAALNMSVPGPFVCSSPGAHSPCISCTPVVWAVLDPSCKYHHRMFHKLRSIHVWSSKYCIFVTMALFWVIAPCRLVEVYRRSVVLASCVGRQQAALERSLFHSRCFEDVRFVCPFSSPIQLLNCLRRL